jgi:hypothetical protein
MRVNSLKRILASTFHLSFRTVTNTSIASFSNDKEKESIMFDDEELERIRNMFANKKL